jgi:hypothetical protein
MDNLRRRQEGPTMGPRRGKSQCFLTRAQTKAEDNENHRVLEGHSRYEEVTVRFESSVDAETRATSRSIIPPRTSSANDRAVGGGNENLGTSTDRGKSTNGISGGTHRKICVGQGKRKGTRRQVPQFGDNSRRSFGPWVGK